jgi:hypothetical protein
MNTLLGAGWKILYDIDERHARAEPHGEITRLTECRLDRGRGIDVNENASECAHAPYDRTQP